METILYNGDCLEYMQDMVNKGIKSECIITDPPYLYLSEWYEKVNLRFKKQWQY